MSAGNEFGQPVFLLLGKINGLNLSALHHQVGGSEFGDVQCPLHHRKCIGVKKSFSQRAAQKRHDFLARLRFVLETAAEQFEKSAVAFFRLFLWLLVGHTTFS